MAITKNSKRKNRLEQLLYLGKEIKYFEENCISGSLQKTKKEKEILEDYIRNIDDAELRNLFEKTYLEKKVGFFNDDIVNRKKNRYLRSNPLTNIYDSQETEIAKQKLEELVNQKRKGNVVKQLSNSQIEQYISELDDSRYRMILRYYLIHDEADRKIRTKVGYSKNTSIFPPLEKYFCN